MAQNDPHVLSAEARTRQRDQAASELVRSLLIINGGGAATLLAFLTAIWNTATTLRRPSAQRAQVDQIARLEIILRFPLPATRRP